MTAIKLSELAAMTEAERKQCLSEFIQAAVNPTPEQLAEQKQELDLAIQHFEIRHGMTSEEMRQALRDGKIQESSDICSWLIRLKIRDRFNNRRTAMKGGNPGF